MQPLQESQIGLRKIFMAFRKNVTLAPVIGVDDFSGGALMRKLFWCICLFSITACANVEQISLSSDFVKKDGASFELLDAVSIYPNTGIPTELHAGTNWKMKGEISQGTVYKTSDQVVTAKGVNQHEAFIVVRDNKIIGFYLPVENTFSPTKEVAILMKPIN